MGSGQSQEAAVWPTGWCAAPTRIERVAGAWPLSAHLAHRRSEIPAEQRVVAREAILQISTEPRPDFLAIENASYCISQADWTFEAYHGAAAAAVQEDKGLNRMIYCLVPRRAAATWSAARSSALTRRPHHVRQKADGERLLAIGELHRASLLPPPLRLQPPPARMPALTPPVPERRLTTPPPTAHSSQYFSKVNYIIDSVKTHGTYPPPAPKPAPPAAKAAAASKPAAAAADDGSSCLLQ